MSDQVPVTIILDGREVKATKGEMIIAAADRAGVYIPRFCYHPRMKPVGMCRMCLVEVEGPRGATLVPACFNPVTDGQKIATASPKAKKAQDGILEFLLINHPLDCPVCDKGGECPLQDQTLAFGPGETRFVEEKRHWDKPTPISDLVYLDRERCIQCARCVRFADEVAGDALIDFAERSDMTEVATFPDAPFASYFSGNVVQICPVGALTAVPYRFKARPWDLEQVESTCTSCSVGCRVAVQSSSDEVSRYIGVDSDPVNWGWLCDKGRFDYEAVNSPERLSAPLVRKGDELVEVSWAEAFVAAAAGLSGVAGAQVALIGGARLPNEDAYAWSKLARAVLHTDNVDAQLGDGLPADLIAGLSRATIDQAASAPLVITLGPDIKEELPVLYLRLRHAVLNTGLTLVELSPLRTGMSRYASQTLQYRPGEAAALVRALAATGEGPAEEVAGVAGADIDIVRAHLARARQEGSAAGPSVVVVIGRTSVGEAEGGLAEAARTLATLPGVAFLSGLRRANVHGALDMGLAPGLLPGRVSLEDGRAWYESRWGASLPAGRGFATSGILAAASHGTVDALVLVGADPLVDFPDRALAEAGVRGARFVVAVDTFLTESARAADVILPAASYAERRGTTTNLEGRISWLGQMVTAPGVSWPDWMIATELAAALGSDLGFASLEEIWTEIESVSPLHEGVTYDRLGSAGGRDGIVVPLGSGPDASTPRPLDPMADPGIASAEIHTVPPASLAVHGPGASRIPTTAGAAGAPRSGGSARSGGERPPMLSSSGPPTSAAGSHSAPVPPSGSGFRLVARRTLWDGGTLVSNSASLARLHPGPAAALHPSQLAALGIADGGRVRVSSTRGALELPAVPDLRVPVGVVVVPWNLPGASASVLIDAGAAATLVEVAALA